jgi:hypothetical protein
MDHTRDIGIDIWLIAAFFAQDTFTVVVCLAMAGFYIYRHWKGR